MFLFQNLKSYNSVITLLIDEYFVDQSIRFVAYKVDQCLSKPQMMS